MSTVTDTLEQRAQTHGDYETKSAFIQDVKDLLRQTPNWVDGNLPEYQRESLDNIVLKIGRICFGDPSERDHFLDIAGYANLGAGWKP